MIQQILCTFLSICILITPLSLASTTETSLNTSSEKTTPSEVVTSTEKESTSTTAYPTTSEKISSTSTSTKPSTTSTTPKTSTTTSTTTTAQPQSSTEWQDIEETESQKLVNFVVSEIQKLKVEHKELDECQELELSSVLSGKKLVSI